MQLEPAALAKFMACLHTSGLALWGRLSVPTVGEAGAVALPASTWPHNGREKLEGAQQASPALAVALTAWDTASSTTADQTCKDRPKAVWSATAALVRSESDAAAWRTAVRRCSYMELRAAVAHPRILPKT